MGSKTYNQDTQKALFNYFTEKWHLRKSTRGWIRGDCPYCSGRDCFAVNPNSFRSKCFKDCGVERNPLMAILKLEGFQTLNEVKIFLKGFDWGDYKAVEVKRVKRRPIILPEHFSLLSIGNTQWGKFARQYIKNKRHLSPNKLALKGWGYCSDGSYKGRIIIPYYKQGHLIYFTSRQYIELSRNKFKNPAFEDFGIGKEMVIYNEDALYIYQKVYLVESIMNAETLGDKAIAIGGKAISPYQKDIILNSPITSIVMILDRDAYKETLKLALELIGEKRIKIIWLPEAYDTDGKQKDVNAFGRAFIKGLENTSRYLSYNEVYSLYLK